LLTVLGEKKGTWAREGKARVRKRTSEEGEGKKTVRLGQWERGRGGEERAFHVARSPQDGEREALCACLLKTSSIWEKKERRGRDWLSAIVVRTEKRRGEAAHTFGREPKNLSSPHISKEKKGVRSIEGKEKRSKLRRVE